MRAKTLITAVFGVSLAVGSFAVLNSVRKGDAGEPKEQILTTTMELPAGTLLRAQDVSWHVVSMTEPDQIVRPPTTLVEAKPEIVEETAASVYGAVLRHALAAGAPVRRGDIVKPGDRDFLQVVLTPGERAIAIPVTTGGASTGLLTPGDRVDVVLTQTFKNENTPLTHRSVGETTVQNLRILAIDALDPKAGTTNPANGNFGRTVTLEVTPEQAETINVAAELGKLSLTLRNINNLATASSDVTSPSQPVRPQWASDVSPALLGATPEKPAAIKSRRVTLLRGGNVADALRKEVVKFDDEENR